MAAWPAWLSQKLNRSIRPKRIVEYNSGILRFNHGERGFRRTHTRPGGDAG